MTTAMTATDNTLRLDKWLWAARFFKTRALATEAINGGKIHVQGQRSKPSKMLAIGHQVSISKGDMKWHITVLGMCKHRRPAKEASLLYAESDDSVQQRNAALAQRKLQHTEYTPKPNKRDRRQIRSFTGKN